MSYLGKGLFKSFFHLKNWVVCGGLQLPRPSRVPPSAPAGGVGLSETSPERSPRRRGPRAAASLAASQGCCFLPRARRRGDAPPQAPVAGVPRPCCAARTRRRRGGSRSALAAAPLSAPAVRAPLLEVGVPTGAHLARGVLGAPRRPAPASRRGSRETTSGGRERPLPWVPGTPAASERGAEGRRPQVRGRGLVGVGGGGNHDSHQSCSAQSRSPLTWRPQEGLAFGVKALRTCPSLPSPILQNICWCKAHSRAGFPKRPSAPCEVSASRTGEGLVALRDLPLVYGKSKGFILRGDFTCWDPSNSHSGELGQPCFLHFSNPGRPLASCWDGKGKGPRIAP